MKYGDSTAEAVARAKDSPLSLRDFDPAVPIPIPDLARALRMRTERTRRILMRLHRKHDEPVLVRNGNRWMVASLNRLRQVWHGVGERPLTAQELTESNADLRHRLEASLERNRELNDQLRGLRARQRATEQRMVELEEAFGKLPLLDIATQRERAVPALPEEVDG